MVIIRPEKNLIIMTRGDTLILDVNIVDADGNEYVPEPTDQLRFALKKSYTDEHPLLIKNIPIDTCELRIDSAETKELVQPGEYVYDIQITYGDGIVSTIIPNANAKTAKLKIVEEVD